MQEYRNSKNKNIQISLLNFFTESEFNGEKDKYFNKKRMKKEWLLLFFNKWWQTSGYPHGKDELQSYLIPFKIFKVNYIQKFKNYIKKLLKENIRENVPTLGLNKYFLVHKSTKFEKKFKLYFMKMKSCSSKKDH